MEFYAHPTAIVEDHCEIGQATKIWHFAHIRKGAKIGDSCIIGKGVYIDAGVRLGNCVKIQNNVSVYHGVEIGDGVFIGPHVCFTNDKLPRAIKQDGSLRGEEDWVLGEIKVGRGVSIGANATIVTGIKLGDWCMVGSGAVVTRDVPPYALVMGNPARVRGIVSPSGHIVARDYKSGVYRSGDGETFEIK